MSRKFLAFAVGLETLGIGIIGAGIGVELALGADLGYALVTGGSLLVAAGGVLFGKFLRRS